MKKTRVNSSSDATRKKLPPALTPEGRESQLISAAMNLAEKQLLDGTATSQVITHFLKLGTEKYEREIEKLRKENALLQAKTESLESAKRMEELYDKAIKSMKDYSGLSGEDEEDI